MWFKARIEAERAKQFLRECRGGRKRSAIVLPLGHQMEVTIYLSQSGAVRFNIPSGNPAFRQTVETWLENVGRPVERGGTFIGIVVRVLPFGVFVAIAPFKEGLLHVSRIPGGNCDSLPVGQTIPVIVEEIDPVGRVNLKTT